MEFKRSRTRIIVDISVTLTTVLDSVDARIIDLSENGAQIVDAAMPAGSKFQIEYLGQTVYAHCIWAEVDRMGVRFPFAMTDGPLRDALVMAIRTDHGMPREARLLHFNERSDSNLSATSPSTMRDRTTKPRLLANFGRRNPS